MPSRRAKTKRTTDPAPAQAKKRATRKRKQPVPDDTKENDILAPPAKRPRLPKKQGRLAAVLSISIDVVFEILGHLDPLDLLRLSRLSKDFRSMLMSKSSITVWRAALENAGLPMPPPTMNEIQWTRLAVENACQTCGAVTRKADWKLLKRLCSKCNKAQLLGISYSRYNGLKDDGPEFVLWRPDQNKPWIKVFDKADHQKQQELFQSLSPPEQATFREERAALLRTLAEHGRLGEEWAGGRSNARASELANLKEERYTSIVAKLTALGWGSEIDSLLPSDDLRNHKAVKAPNLLTERTWHSIQPELVAHMQLMKSKRIGRDFLALVEQRKVIAADVWNTYKKSQFPWTDIMPGAPDFWAIKPVYLLLQQPADVTIDSASFEALLPDMPDLISTWRTNLARKLVLCHKDLAPGQADDLQLAKCVFKCTHCRAGGGLSMLFGMSRGAVAQPLFWPRVLSHRCNSHQDEFLPWLMSSSGKATEWSTRSLEFDKEAAKVVVKIVEACGLDPDATTVQEMDDLDARFACHDCAKRNSTYTQGGSSSTENSMQPAIVSVYTWRNAVVHERADHPYLPVSWHQLDDAAAAVAREKEAAILAQDPTQGASTTAQDDQAYLQSLWDSLLSNTTAGATANALFPATDSKGKGKERVPAEGEQVARAIIPAQYPEVAFCCTHCFDDLYDKAPTTLNEIKTHLSTKHAILTPTENEDYYRSLAAPELYNNKTFPAPKIAIRMPPAPPMDNYTGYSDVLRTFGYGMYDSDDSDDDDMMM
ncbi:F-box domain-containing protein [Mycena kentingensis (nom. inval.)]|nr:F-box domain-containing protein [Mycena kentingensis (nom. inval.)]